MSCCRGGLRVCEGCCLIWRTVVRKRRAISRLDRRRFLEAISEGSTLKAAAELTGHPRDTYYKLKERDPGFAEELALAEEAGTDTLEQEAIRRARDGWDEEVYGKGPSGAVEFVGTVRKYDSNLLARLLAGRREKYRDSPRINLTQQMGRVEVVDRSASDWGCVAGSC